MGAKAQQISEKKYFEGDVMEDYKSLLIKN
jgi:hypothetical protein